jgi:hypothetical protein
MIISNCTNQEKYEINEILNQNDEQMNHNQTQTPEEACLESTMLWLLQLEP